MKSRHWRRALNDFRRHPWLHLLGVATISVALLILGAFLVCFRNVEHLAHRTSPQATGTVYLRETPAPEALKELRERILFLERVKTVTYKPKANVLKELHGFLGSAGMPQTGEEFFPDVVEIELLPNTTATQIKALTEILARFPEVAEVDFSEDWLAQYKRVRSFLGAFGLALLVAVVIGCSFITANFMGIRYQARREEIDIVRLIGANRTFVVLPFLIEGVLEGAVAALLSLGSLYLFTALLSTALSVQWASLLGMKEWLFLSPLQALGLLALGVLIACLGSVAVFLRFSRVR